MKKKVLVVCNNAQGLYIFRSLLISNLINGEYEVFAIVPDDNDPIEETAIHRLQLQGCKIIRTLIDRRGINPIKDFNLMYRYAKYITSVKPNLVITYTIKPNIYANFISRVTGIPYIANITGLGSAFYTNSYLKNIVIWMYKVALKSAKCVLFENENDREIFVTSRIIGDSKTKVLKGAGVDLNRYSYATYPDYTGVNKFLYIGRVMKEKGIDELLAAMKSISAVYPCQLVILGYIEDDYVERLRLFQKEGWLEYKGFIQDVRPYIAQSHCVILPSWHEGMANSNLEAAAMGRPIITSNIFGCKEAVIDGKTGFLFRARDIDDLQEKILLFIKLAHSKKIEMGLQGRKHMELVFDKELVVQETIKIIEKNIL